MNLLLQRVGEFSIRIRTSVHLTVPVPAGSDLELTRGANRMGEKLVGEDPGSTDDRFVWSTDRYRLMIWLDEGQWAIQHTAPNPLLGPMVISEARHRQAKQAVWEVMSRVTKATRDDEEGVRVASSAARWMRQMGQSSARVQLCD
ncbi:MAG: hypothetical protein KC438_01550 [Thermomicrobiales bacterium]|nr:hypothetical protein [Thermomicrobiales bacterium]